MPKYRAEFSSDDPKEVEQVLDSVKVLVNCNTDIQGLSVHVSAEPSPQAQELNPVVDQINSRGQK